MRIANNKTQEYIKIINPFIKYFDTNRRKVPLKFPHGKQLETQRGKIYRSIQVSNYGFNINLVLTGNVLS